MVPEDAKLILSIPMSATYKPDKWGWHYTKNGKYTVKSGYKVAKNIPYSKLSSPIYGPDICPLLAQVWTLKCPPKLKHFMWQVLSGFVPVMSKLRQRGIKCETVCERCGDDMESINHALFECPPALQTWALSSIGSCPGIFPTSSIYSNMDYLFWHQPKQRLDNRFPWILWYIWKSRNDKVFTNSNLDSREIVKLAESEALAWELAQNVEGDTISQTVSQSPTSVSSVPLDFQCFVDGSWKEIDVFSGLGWISKTREENEDYMGARNVRSSLSPLHTEFEALLWAMQCMLSYQRLSVNFHTDSLELVKMISTPEDWPAFSVYLEDFMKIKSLFSFFSLSFIPRSLNSKADLLARSVRLQSDVVSYVNSVFPTWLPEPL